MASLRHMLENGLIDVLNDVVTLVKQAKANNSKIQSLYQVGSSEWLLCRETDEAFDEMLFKLGE